MNPGMERSRRVVIIGTGAVGSTYAYALMQSGLAEEIVLLDKNPDLAEGQAMDLAHGLPFVPAAGVRSGDESDLADAALVVVTAGAKQKPGQSRLDLLRVNAAIAQDIAGALERTDPQTAVLVVSNPVDIMTYLLLEYTGWPRNRIFGSGTVLDSARFRYLISRHCGIDPRNVHAYILGEHGDSELPVWSMTHIAGLPMDRYCPRCRLCSDHWQETRARIVEQVRNSAYHIIDYKGATWFAVSLAMVRISEAVLRNEHTVLTVSARLDGEYGLRDVCISVPCVVGRAGIERIIEADLTPEEKTLLARSAATLQARIAELRGAEG